jgi:hypothetical protein
MLVSMNLPIAPFISGRSQNSGATPLSSSVSRMEARYDLDAARLQHTAECYRVVHVDNWLQMLILVSVRCNWNRRISSAIDWRRMRMRRNRIMTGLRFLFLDWPERHGTLVPIKPRKRR